ncbi:EbsA family protein [Enterococcus sp. BWR-S5]|uniref:EbsA family protein n=1 Tax=Enterococcus sp. BWR-S5 TaxID=2787714 RepID=UPI00192102D2|nr:EbsA family protein [Enterococcus sp. BWR-S5]MBL1226300.1 EbsA family protein [Enterococcus sp. BWR-S5]
MKQKKYHWQPELSMAIISWSCTFAILFLSLILSLEYTRPYLVSNIVLAVFFVFALLGLNRYFKLTDRGVVIHYLLPFRKKELRLESIQTIKIGTKSIEIVSEAFSSGSRIFIMPKKQKEGFIEALKEKSLTDKIVYDDQLKLGEH